MQGPSDVLHAHGGDVARGAGIIGGGLGVAETAGAAMLGGIEGRLGHALAERI